MKIICLFAQRKCIYPGQYAPELMVAVDEITNDDNPDYLHDEEEIIKKDSDIDFYKRIEINVSDKDFDKVFFGENQIIGIIKRDD